MSAVKSGRRRELVTVLLCVVAVGVIGFQVAVGGPVVHTDTAVRSWVLRNQVDGVRQVLGALVYLGYVPVVLPLTFLATVVMSTFRRTVHVVAMAVLAAASLAVVGFSLKILVARPSPSGLTDPLDGAWPSGHAMTVTVVVGILLELTGSGTKWARRRGAAAGVVPLVVGVALVYGDHHWLSDVLAGLLLGWAIVLAARAATYRLREVMARPVPPAADGDSATRLRVGAKFRPSAGAGVEVTASPVEAQAKPD